MALRQRHIGPDMYARGRPLLLAGKLALLILASLILCACTSVPERSSQPGTPVSANVASAAVSTALAMVGKPYRRGGNSPAGFDCSGLVQYSYVDAGLTLPRDTRGLRRTGTRVHTGDLQPGDLLFFDQDGKSRSHVGLYIGDDRFVHAPSTGGKVRIDRTDAAFWRRHFIEARRP